MIKQRYIVFVMFVCLILASFTRAYPGKSVTPVPPHTTDTVFVYDTIVVYDTVYIEKTIVETFTVYDTILYIEPPLLKNQRIRSIPEVFPSPFYAEKINKFAPRSVFSAGMNFGVSYPKILLSGSPGMAEYLTAMKLSVSSLPTYTLGIEINRHNKFLDFGTGLNFAAYNTNFRHSEIEISVDSVYKYNFFNRTEIDFDTIFFLNIDTLLATGDSVWYAYIDTNFVSRLDSSLVFTSDTSETLQPVQTINRLACLEIPLILSCPLIHGTNNISVQAGIIPGIIMFSSGKIVSLMDYDGSESIQESIKTSRFILSLYLGLTAEIPIDTRFMLKVSGHVKQNMMSVYSNYPISQSYRDFGVKFGLIYRFNH